jgi:hypothetical protein
MSSYLILHALGNYDKILGTGYKMILILEMNNL